MRHYVKPNMDAGSVRSHVRPTMRRKRLWRKDIDEREWLVDGTRVRDLRHSQPVPSPVEALAAMFADEYDFDDFLGREPDAHDLGIADCYCCCSCHNYDDPGDPAEWYTDPRYIEA